MIKIKITGDISFAGEFSKLSSINHSWVSPKVKELLQGDIVIGNLECVLLKYQPPKNQSLQLGELGDIPIKAIKEAGINVMTLANNHIMDFGELGLKSTIDYLKDNQIKY